MDLVQICFIFGVCGGGIFFNILTILVIVYSNIRSASTPLMITLAICDLLSLLLTICGQFIIRKSELYSVIMEFILYGVDLTSTYITVDISIERFIAVVFPIKSQVLLSNRRAWIATAITILLCFIIMSPLFLRLWIDYLIENAMGIAVFYFYYMGWIRHVLTAIIPFVVMIFCNCAICIKIFHAREKRIKLTTAISPQSPNGPNQNHQHAKITTMLLSVVIVFGVCHIPTVALAIVDVILLTQDSLNIQTENHLRSLHDIFGKSEYYGTRINSSLNFFVYFVFGKSFRENCAKMLNRFFSRCKTRRNHTSRRIELSKITSVSI